MRDASKKRVRFKNVWRRLLLAIGGVFVAFLGIEGLLRVSGYSSGNFYRRDQVLGATLRPRAEGWWTREGRDYVTINSDGLRDREHSTAKPAHTFRIAVLGDSYAEALQLPMQHSFWAVMESKLQACPAFSNRTIEVINFGVSGYGTAQELLTLREKVWKYDPDVVLLAVTTGNDISDDSRLLKGTEDMPYFVLSGGRLVLDDSFRNNRRFRWHASKPGRIVDWSIDRSLTLQAIRMGMNAISERWTRDQNLGDSRASGLFSDVYHEPRDQTWSDAWRVTEALIAEMAREVRNRGAQFFVVTLSSPPQVYPEAKFRSDFMQREGVSDLFYPDHRIQNVCEHEGIQMLALAPVLQEYADRNHVFLHGFNENMGSGHWNEQGHLVSGQFIGDWLCGRLR